MARSMPPVRSSDTSSPSSAEATEVMGGVLPTTSLSRIGALAAFPVTSSYSSSAITSIASGSSRNFTRLGMRRMTPPSAVSPNVVLLTAP